MSISTAPDNVFKEDWEWTETTLGKLADFEMGQAPPGTECNKEGKGTVFVKAGEFRSLYPEEVEWTTKPLKFGKKGDVFICVVGATAGKLNLGIDCAIGRSVAAIRPKAGVDTKFIYYQLMPWVLRLRAASAGSAQGVISKVQLNQIPFRIVGEPQQEQIVAEIEKQFSRLDEAVANLKRVRANLKRYKAAVLKAAVEGKLTKEWRKAHPGVEPASELLKRILAERRAKWNGKGKYKEPAPPDRGKLPDLTTGWRWVRLEQLGSIFGGFTKNPQRNKLPRKLPYLRVANVYANELRLDEIEEIGVEEDELDKLLLHPGDLLVVEGNGSKDQIGRLAIWDGSISPCVHQNHIIKVRLLNIDLGKWILFWLLSLPGRNFVEEVASSTSGLYTLSVNKVASLPILLPPFAEQQFIVEEVERRLSVNEELTIELEANLKRVERLRQSILQRAFSGTLLLPSNRSREAQVTMAVV
jgi:type I restriction enzyme, S subunit